MKTNQQQFSAVEEYRYYTSVNKETEYEPDPVRLEQDIAHWIPDLPGIFHGKDILDLGAGRAPLGTLIAKKFSANSVISLEFVLDRLLSVNRKATPSELLLACGDVFHLPFESASFDYIVANSFLHHLPNLYDAVCEISRVLRPGGMYIGREPNFDNSLVRSGVFGIPYLPLIPTSHSPNEYPLRAQQISDVFSKVGCQCELHYFWRRLPALRHPYFSFAISVRAKK